MSLGHWVVIDIETTGINEANDHIIDLGFLHFEGCKLIQKYSSLVRTDIPISNTIQKLTGITQSQVNKAPLWKTVVESLYEQEGASFIAHNARFEEGFLAHHLMPPFKEEPNFVDSIPYLALLNPGKAKLNLESFIIDNNIAEKEDHRGLSDSIDLLKVLIIETLKLKRDPEREVVFLSNMKTLEDDFWFAKFARLDQEELIELANEIDFDVIKLLSKKEQEKIKDSTSLKPASLEFSSDNIEKILTNDKELKTVLPGYQYRKSQSEMIKRVGQAFNNRVHALIQAPTGTGKTLGYLIPSALFSLNKKEPVLISTATKALQKQAMEKDYPTMLKILGLTEEDLKITHLIGSKNHYCELKYRKEHEKSASLFNDFSIKFFKAYFELLFFENARGYQSFITREGFPYLFKIWSSEIRQKEAELAVDYRACAGHKCIYSDSCSYYQGIKSAQKADIILGNHALTMNWPRSLTMPKYIVFDEAHKLEGEATKCFSFQVSGTELNSFIKNLPNLLGPLYYLLGQDDQDEKIHFLQEKSSELAEKVSELTDTMLDSIEEMFKKMPRYTAQYWNELPMINKNSLQDPQKLSLYNKFENIYIRLEDFYKILLPFFERYLTDKNKDESKEIVAVTALENLNAQLGDIVQALGINLSEAEDYSKAIRFHEKEGYELIAAPINIGKAIYEGITKNAESVVLTSATLANATGDRGVRGIEWSTGYSFVDPEKRFKHGFFLPEVFDYQKAKTVLVTDTPSLYDSNFVTTVLEQISSILKEMQGGALLLFSARARFEKAVEYLLKEIDHSIPVFIQGMGNNIVEDFKKAEKGVLIGMETFGEGIDIPGKKLRFVYIDKIPDLRMDLVTQERRDFFDREFGNEFRDYYLSLRARSLHQKFGRLLRTESDSGAIMVTDSRLARWKGRTLGDFKKLMEPYDLKTLKLKEAVTEIKDFLNQSTS